MQLAFGRGVSTILRIVFGRDTGIVNSGTRGTGVYHLEPTVRRQTQREGERERERGERQRTETLRTRRRSGERKRLSGTRRKHATCVTRTAARKGRSIRSWAVISGSVYAFHGARGFTSRRVERRFFSAAIFVPPSHATCCFRCVLVSSLRSPAGYTLGEPCAYTGTREFT